MAGRPRGEKTTRLYDIHLPEIVARYEDGEPIKDIAVFFDVHEVTIRNWLKKVGKHGRIDHPVLKSREIRKFTSAARSILFRMDPTDHYNFYAWRKRVEFVEKEHSHSRGEAILRASKEWVELHALFYNYDVKHLDKDPESHPAIKFKKEWEDRPKFKDERAEIENESIKQCYSDNLEWAMEAAGEFLRTGITPKKCPNDKAYFLYKEAIGNSKEFLMRFTQLEKGKAGDDKGDAIRRKGQTSIDEINSMLDNI